MSEQRTIGVEAGGGRGGKKKEEGVKDERGRGKGSKRGKETPTKAQFRTHAALKVAVIHGSFVTFINSDAMNKLRTISRFSWEQFTPPLYEPLLPLAQDGRVTDSPLLRLPCQLHPLQNVSLYSLPPLSTTLSFNLNLTPTTCPERPSVSPSPASHPLPSLT